MASPVVSVVPEGSVSVDGRRQISLTADVVFGPYVVLSYLYYSVSHRSPLWAWSLLVFVAANVLITQITVLQFKKQTAVTREAYLFEFARAVAGGIIAPLAYWQCGWWQGFLIMCLGQCIILGMSVQRRGHVLVAYYVGLYLLTTWLSGGKPDWQQVAWNGSVIAMAGAIFAEMIPILGRTLKNERERTFELAQSNHQLAAARDKLWAEVEVAQKIQTLLLPRSPKYADGTMVGKMVPASEVGGDYYDVMQIGGRTFVAIGDVSGHGVQAGLIMMMARSSLLGVLEADPKLSLSEIYRALNRSLCANIERMVEAGDRDGTSIFMTFGLLEYLGDGRFAAVGRHLPLLIYRQRQAEFEEIDLAGTWLGIKRNLGPNSQPEAKFALGSGDLLVLYTDGLTEQFVGDDMFGEERLMEIVKRHAAEGPARLIDALLAEVDRLAPVHQDDITLLVIDHQGEVSSRQPIAA